MKNKKTLILVLVSVVFVSLFAWGIMQKDSVEQSKDNTNIDVVSEKQDINAETLSRGIESINEVDNFEEILEISLKGEQGMTSFSKINTKYESVKDNKFQIRIENGYEGSGSFVTNFLYDGESKYIKFEDRDSMLLIPNASSIELNKWLPLDADEFAGLSQPGGLSEIHQVSLVKFRTLLDENLDQIVDLADGNQLNLSTKDLLFDVFVEFIRENDTTKGFLDNELTVTFVVNQVGSIVEIHIFSANLDLRYEIGGIGEQSLDSI